MPTRYTPEQAEKQMQARALLERFGDSAESGRATFTKIVLDLIASNEKARNSANTAANIIAKELYLPKDLTFELLLSVWATAHEKLKATKVPDIIISL